MLHKNERILKNENDAHLCDACQVAGKNTFATHSVTDAQEVSLSVWVETPERYGCDKNDHEVVSMIKFVDGTTIPFDEYAK